MNTNTNPKVYLAAAFGRKTEMLQLAIDLARVGIEVTSSWLTELMPTGVQKEKFLTRTALMDWRDIKRADILVRFSDAELMQGETVDSKLLSASRIAEMGIALERGIPCIVVGGKQCVFDYLPHVIHVKDVAELMSYLDMYAKGGSVGF